MTRLQLILIAAALLALYYLIDHGVFSYKKKKYTGHTTGKITGFEDRSRGNCSVRYRYDVGKHVYFGNMLLNGRNARKLSWGDPLHVHYREDRPEKHIAFFPDEE